MDTSVSHVPGSSPEDCYVKVNRGRIRRASFAFNKQKRSCIRYSRITDTVVENGSFLYIAFYGNSKFFQLILDYHPCFKYEHCISSITITSIQSGVILGVSIPYDSFPKELFRKLLTRKTPVYGISGKMLSRVRNGFI